MSRNSNTVCPDCNFKYSTCMCPGGAGRFLLPMAKIRRVGDVAAITPKPPEFPVFAERRPETATEVRVIRRSRVRVLVVAPRQTRG